MRYLEERERRGPAQTTSAASYSLRRRPAQVASRPAGKEDRTTKQSPRHKARGWPLAPLAARAPRVAAAVTWRTGEDRRSPSRTPTAPSRARCRSMSCSKRSTKLGGARVAKLERLSGHRRDLQGDGASRRRVPEADAYDLPRSMDRARTTAQRRRRSSRALWTSAIPPRPVLRFWP